MLRFHDAIVYVDESGDHGPKSPEYPVFVLAFCIFDKQAYAQHVTTAVQRLKFRYLGHDTLPLHEREIRKQQRPFDFLHRKDLRDAFFSDLNALIRDAEFSIVAAVIRKDRFRGAENVYHAAMRFGLERVAREHQLEPESAPMHVVCESRGKREDAELELEFRRICDGHNYLKKRLPFEVIFAPKNRCHAGMELADLVARPIGRRILNPSQPNRAWDLLEPKFRRSPEGQIEGWGLKVFP